MSTLFAWPAAAKVEIRIPRDRLFRQAGGGKAIRALYPDYEIWRDFPYEYELDRLAIDVINGGPGLREWVDDPAASPIDLDRMATNDETEWRDAVEPHLLY